MQLMNCLRNLVAACSIGRKITPKGICQCNCSKLRTIFSADYFVSVCICRIVECHIFRPRQVGAISYIEHSRLYAAKLDQLCAVFRICCLNVTQPFPMYLGIHGDIKGGIMTLGLLSRQDING